MNVNTYLEIYTTHYGWGLYGAFWSVLAGTGLALWPFLKMIYDNWRSPAESSSSEAPGSLESIQRMKWSLFFKVFMLAMAVVPLSNMATTNTAYQNSCGNTVHGTHSFGNTGTTWDALAQTASGGNSGTKVPILFHLALKISYGINSYMIQGLPCLGDVRALDQQMHNITLGDLALEQEYSQFFSDCFGPAKTRAIEAVDSRSGDPDVDRYYQSLWQAYLNNGGKQEDLNNMNSKFYRNTPGLYAPCNSPECRSTFQAKNPVTAFNHDSTRDAGMSPQQATANQGQPYCGQWWANLKPRLTEGIKFRYTQYDSVSGQEYSAPRHLANIIGTWGNETVRRLFADPDARDDWILGHLQRSAPPGLIGGEGPGAVGSTLQAVSGSGKGGMDDWAALGLGTAGLGILSKLPFVGSTIGDVGKDVVGEFVGFYATMYLVKKAAPMMKALVLMLIFALLPLYLIISEYEVGAVITAMILVMVVNMFSVMFEVASYLEIVMFEAMYPGWAVANATLAYGVEIILIDLLLLLLFVVAPMLMLAMVQMAGQRIRESGSAGAGQTQQVGRMGGNVGGKLGRSAQGGMNKFGKKR